MSIKSGGGFHILVLSETPAMLNHTRCIVEFRACWKSAVLEGSVLDQIKVPSSNLKKVGW